MNITPRHDNVLVKRDIIEVKHQALKSITSKVEIANTGEVISIGPEVTDLKKGDRVFFNKHAGKEILKQKRLWLMQSEELLATI